MIRHGTLTASTVATVNLGEDLDEVEILNRDGADEIYCTVDGSNPTVGGNDCLVIPASISAISVPSASGSTTVVKLISAGTPKYTVTAFGSAGYGTPA